MHLSQRSSVPLPLGLQWMEGAGKEGEGIMWFLFTKKGEAGMSPRAGLRKQVVSCVLNGWLELSASDAVAKELSSS